MAKVDITNENESKQETSTYKGFNNKFLKAALLAVGSYYLAKKDPYVLKGINDVKDKLEEADAESRRDYIKASATSIGKVIAENRAKRKERLISFKQKIKDLNQYTKDSYLSANIVKDNLYAEMMKFGKQGTDITTLYKITDDFKKNNTTIGLTDSELAGALAGPVNNITKNLNTKFLAPKKTSFVSNFITGGGQEDVSDEVKAQIQALAPETDAENIEDIYVGGGSLTERGKQFLTPRIRGDYAATLSNNSVVDAIITSLGGTRKVTPTSAGLVYSYDSTIKGRVQIGEAIALDVNRRIANLIEEEQGMSRVEATQLVIRQLELNNKEGKYIKLGLNSGAKIQTNLSQFQPAQTIAQIRGQDTQSNQTKKIIQSQKKSTVVKPPPKVTKLPQVVQIAQNKLVNLYKNPPRKSQGGGKQIDSKKLRTTSLNLSTTLEKLLVNTPNSPYQGDPKGAKKYVKEFIAKL